MKTLFKMISKAVLCFAVLFSGFAAPVMAKTGTKPASGTAYLVAGKYGQKKTEFTFNTTTTGSTKLYYNCTKGVVGTTINLTHTGKDCYGFFEVQVWGKKGNSWVSIYTKSNGTQKNVKDSKSSYISISGYTTYKVAVWSWNTKSLPKKYGSNCLYVTDELHTFSPKTFPVYSLPKITFSWLNAK